MLPSPGISKSLSGAIVVMSRKPISNYSKHHMIKSVIVSFLIAISVEGISQQLFEMPARVDSRLSSFENANGVKGQGGKTNKTAKGRAFEVIKPGETKTLLNVNGEGIIQRIWLTINQSPVKLRSLRFQ